MFSAENDYAGETQGATQQSSQAFYHNDAHPMERPFFGCLQPCNGALRRIDFVKTQPLIAIGRGANNDFVLPGMRISKQCLSPFPPSLCPFTPLLCPRGFSIYLFIFPKKKKKELC